MAYKLVKYVFIKKTFLFLSICLVIFSFLPSLYEIYYSRNLSPQRAFVLEHNYLFDFNFYLSRIRQGQEGRWLVSEKYYNQPHQGSFFQIFYLLLGKMGSWFGLSPPMVYHLTRLVMGFILLILVAYYLSRLFSGGWQVIAYLLVVTSSSWPILVRVGTNWRFATYMGWWSVVDSLQRITFIPHILLGQIFILLFVWVYSQEYYKKQLGEWLIWGVIGFVVGIIFPPTLVVVYTVFSVLSVLEIVYAKVHGEFKIKDWLTARILPRTVFILLSLVSFAYLRVMFKVLPWSALAIFDIENRMLLPYKDYALSLGPMLPLGIVGLIVALAKKEKKLFAVVSWVLSLGLLFAIFEHVPQQSPLRFTEAAINIPLGVLTTYLFYILWQSSSKLRRSFAFGLKSVIRILVTIIILMGLGVMMSTAGWLTDQVRWKGEATWLVPVGAQLAYPLKDFMDGVYFLRDNTKREEVVLAYITAGNYIPAYAGNFVYLGHANTPDEKEKEGIAARFFSGKMGQNEAKEFLAKERISYIYFGPQERELGTVADLARIYPFISPVYSNKQVVIYRVK